MGKVNALDVLKQCFKKIVPEKDARTKISPLEFVVCLIFCYLGDSKTFSLVRNSAWKSPTARSVASSCALVGWRRNCL